MNKIKIIIAALSAAVLLCGCSSTGRVRSSTSSDSSVSEAEQPVSPTSEPSFKNDFNDTSKFLDESDAVSEGVSSQPAAAEYDVSEAGEEPVSEVDVKSSPDGEIFEYDSQGRLRYYRNSDEIYNTLPAPTSDQPNVAMGWYARDVIGSFMNVYTNGMSIEGYAENTFIVRQNGTEVTGIMQLTDEGDIRWFSINYDVPSSVIPEGSFDSDIDAYLAELDDVASVGDKGVRYMQTNGRVYALYTVTVTSSDGNNKVINTAFSKSAV
ncbi:MAG: hypothetical protein IJ737_01290 [Ruminococcus sp.]|nr:hypothetical protein [Ruminococcus sp.]MBR2282935.1 hypothetical protein [Ruminococcus sp.]